MHQNLAEVDIRKVSLTGNEKRFNNLRTNFYKTLNDAENKKEIVKDKRTKYTNFFKNLNKNQLKIPPKKVLNKEKETLFDMILTDMVDDQILSEKNKRKFVREKTSKFKRIEDDLEKVYRKKKREDVVVPHKEELLDDLLVPADIELYQKMKKIGKYKETKKRVQISEDLGIDHLKHQRDSARSSSRRKLSKRSNDSKLNKITLGSLANQSTKMHIKNIKFGRELTFEDIDKFPESISEIVKMNEYNNPLQEMKDSSEICENLRKNGLIEHSILQQNYFYMDESQGINYYKDLSSYSRKVFKEPR
jgi:hypothetical protein